MRNTTFTKTLARGLFGAGLVVALAAPTLAAPEGCWSRQYSDAHLARQPAQVVAAAWLSFHFDQDHDQLFAMLSVVTTNQGHVRGTANANMFVDQGLLCWPNTARGADAWSCAIDGDGGGFEITRMDAKVLEFRTRHLLMGNFEDNTGPVVNLAEQAWTDVTYRLYRADDAACETN
ncbi:hypothetical protein [Aliiroseovarius subalbicans]|uniref:hypothetical protein n=1 Tax=Aliiroseovarius subalbicans TaxID=2925840 RepID=UPI001F57DFCE|nr:hypothetical protein [Aliiroseovarius subalbicans]MCI2398588.1 hypothetical protein [Aliiroseovarius subalbicans]